MSIFRLVFFVIARSVYRTEKPISNLARGPKNRVHFIPYIDVYLCRNGRKLAELVAKYPAIERVLCGHIHRFMQLRFGGTMLCTAPSTTTALALRPWPTADAASYIEPPAMLLHHWKPDTGLITHFVPIGAFRGPLAFA